MEARDMPTATVGRIRAPQPVAGALEEKAKKAQMLVYLDVKTRFRARPPQGSDG